MEENRKYYEAYDDRYRQVHQAAIQWRVSEEPSKIVMDTIRKYGIEAEAKILELGCGEGTDACCLMKHGLTVLATDVSPEAIRFCREKNPHAAESFQVLDCVNGTLGGQFDFIYAVAVLHMLVQDEDREAFYRFINGHLRENGIALICTMGDGCIERRTDITEAFELQKRVHPENGRDIMVAATSCRMVGSGAFQKEIAQGGLEIVEEGFTSRGSDFPLLMYGVVKRRKKLPALHNHEERLKYYELLLEKEAAGPFPEAPLPKGYRYTNYRDGDRKDWIAVEYSAGEFISKAEGEESWARFYGGKEAELYDRMYFIETDAGEKVATATSYYEPKDPEGSGWLHWVAVKQEYQGKGLARPLVSHVLNRLVELHYAKIKIPTQTTTWLAVRLYLSFGFRPVPKNAVTSREGYRMMRTLTGHPALYEFPAVPEDELWDEEMCAADRYMKTRFGDRVRFRVNKEKRKIIYQAGDTCGELENIEKYLTGEKKDS